MLYFSKLRIISVIFFTLIFSYFAFSNFIKFDDNFFKQKINLGLDLKGGSYLLLEIDNTPVIEQKLQNKVYELKKFFNEKALVVSNFIVEDQNIKFNSYEDFEKVNDILNDKESLINPYYQNFKEHEFVVKSENGKLFIKNNKNMQPYLFIPLELE